MLAAFALAACSTTRDASVPIAAGMIGVGSRQKIGTQQTLRCTAAFQRHRRQAVLRQT